MGRLALTLGLCLATTVAHAQPPLLEAMPRASATVVIDGILDESIWRTAPRGADFVERRPDPGGSPPVETSVRVLYDEASIFVAVVSNLAEGEVPSATELIRDSHRIHADDSVTIKFDVRHDRRATVGFGVNVAGARTDYLATENGRRFRREHDAVWDVSTVVGEGSWTAEFRIPIAALGLAPNDRAERILGFNVSRNHRARRAVYDWSHMPPELGGVAATHYGELHGLRGVAGGRPLSVVPHFLLRYQREGGADLFPRHSPYELGAGTDISARLAEDVWAEISLLTDFAGVDLDDAVVNLNRFPLFVPERRPFFLTGADIFDFGEPGEAQAFFSRRIGLDEEGAEVPMWVGLKAHGHTGALGIGLMHVVTGEPTTHWSVARARLDVGASAQVGAIATMRAPADGSPDLSVGADASLRALDDRLEVTGFWMATIDDEESTGRTEGLPMGAGARARFGGEKLTPEVSVVFVDEELDPAIGFIRQPGRLRSEASLGWTERVPASGVEVVSVAGTIRHDASVDLSKGLGARAELGADLVLRNGVATGAMIAAARDVVEQPFALRSDVDVDAGTYEGLEAAIGVGLVSDRNPSGHVVYHHNRGFFGGVAHTIELRGDLAAGAHVRVTGGADMTVATLPGRQRFSALAANTTLTLAPSTDVAVDVTAQYDDTNGHALGQARIRYRYSPGSDIVFVLHEEVDTSSWASKDRSVMLKATYRWDTVL